LFKVEETPSTPKLYYNRAVAAVAGLRKGRRKRWEGAMTEAMRDALELIRSLKEQYPDETEDQLISRFHKELEGDQALRRALMRDVFKHLLQELGEGKPPNSKE
jgi:hypothetical protein